MLGRTIVTYGTLALLLGLSSGARADIPRSINFQGRLADNSGSPVTKQYTMWARIYYSTDGQPAQLPGTGAACHEASQTVAVNSGLFNVVIANVSASCDFGKPYWLEIQVCDGTCDSPMSPRIALTTASYAFTAARLVAPGTNDTYAVGNTAGSIPLSNGTVNATLNADTVDGSHLSDIMNAMNKPLYFCNKGASEWQRVVNSSSCVVRTTFGSCVAVDASPTAPACPAGCSSVGTHEVGCSYHIEYVGYNVGHFAARICSCSDLPVVGYAK